LITTERHIKKRTVHLNFSSHNAHRAALISVSLGLSHISLYTARPRIRGYTIVHRAVCLFVPVLLKLIVPTHRLSLSG